MQNIKKQVINDFDGGIKESYDPELLRSFDVADKNVDPKYIKSENVKLNKDKFRVSGDGIFYTLQGEGVSMGVPTIFLRLHVCNLRCVWCDAYYTWNPKSKEFWTESQEVEPSLLATKLKSLWLESTESKEKRLVVTGGEPLLQKDLIDVLMLELGKGWITEIETNGTIMPTETQLEKCQFNCSPKLRNSGNIDKVRIRPDVLKALNKTNTSFKFVVMNDDDIDEIEKIFVNTGFIDRSKIILMPQGVTTDEVQSNARNIVEKAKRKGYRLMGRLQVDVWGAKRRV